MTSTYPSYKPTPIPWLPQIPEHWGLLRNKYIMREIVDRSNSGMEDLLSVSQYTGVTLKKDKLENDDDLLTTAATLEGYKKVQKDDLVINIMLAWNGSLGVSPYDGITSPAYSVYRFNEKINPKYFHYLFRTKAMSSYFRSVSSGVIESRLRMYTIDFFKLYSFIPPLPEQTAIANYLDAKTNEISTFIEKKEKLIALLKEQKQAVINKAVTKGIRLNAPMKDSGVEWLGDIPSHWKVIKLKYIANAIIGVTYSPNDIVDERKGILVLRSSNIQNGRLSFSDNVFIKKEIPQKLLTQKGDILLCARNGSADLIGKNVCIDESAIGLTFGAFMTIVRSKYWSYLSWFFNSSIFKSQTGLFATSTINQLTSDTLNNLKIAFPTDSSEREEIIKTIEIEAQQIDLGIEKIEKEIELVKELKQSLIAEVVTGKIKIT